MPARKQVLRLLATTVGVAAALATAGPVAADAGAATADSGARTIARYAAENPGGTRIGPHELSYDNGAMTVATVPVGAASTCAPGHFCVYSKTHYNGVKVTYNSKLGCHSLPKSVKKQVWSYQNRTDRIAGIGNKGGVHRIPKRGTPGAFNPSTKRSLATSALSACVTGCTSTATGKKAVRETPASRAARSKDVSIMC
ncbi:peptidase inhibitor family I36 protein [Spirillospora sp. CA-128828]|uniref:peptidase inhibitor family I36 protein n=1 Tax=Spirillospora sp. CA-128828 TaxID=3240033 RepID=UPI003D948E62